MPGRKTIRTLFHLCGAASAAAIALGGAYASAQPVAVEELTVKGIPPKGIPETFSYRVGYSDLDLRTDAGKKELSKRIQVTAAYVCRKINELDHACEMNAVDGARAQVRAAERAMRASGNHPGRGTPWVPPPG